LLQQGILAPKHDGFNVLNVRSYKQECLKMKAETTFYERRDFYLLKRFDDIAMLKLGEKFLFDSKE
jgi:hypothetical protein